ncbi:helix-turn-helix domain-containing protein [Candidatus Pantoea multigeneris]|uniref:Uncharacterized protein n=1 Tax=Candidatus Pantoea multigeneris TaxID=2608357 RepID=A0ABX0RKH5_9GAMM|nr:helix-turn-helix domain-containing protein [Pantoea multigeneris]NIF23909.1 hypothetical protein [Pantoea multigeneris]
MEKAGDILIHMARPAGVTSHFFSSTDKEYLYSIALYALRYHHRDPGWFEVKLDGERYFACSTVTIPLYVIMKRRWISGQNAQFVAAAAPYIYSEGSEKEPPIWIAIRADVLTPLPRPCVNLWHARKLSDSYKCSRHFYPGMATPELHDTLSLPDNAPGEKETPAPTVIPSSPDKTLQTETIPTPETAPPSVIPEVAFVPENKMSHADPEIAGITSPGEKEETPRERIKKEKEQKEAEVMEYLHQGWAVPDIASAISRSTAFVYKVLQSKGLSAMDLRWMRWQHIADMYKSEPPVPVQEIEKICNVTRQGIYHAVKKIAERDNVPLPKQRSNKKLTTEDERIIREKLESGVMRKDICKEYNISHDTLTKYFGHEVRENALTDRQREHIVRLTMQGKTREQVARMLNVTVSQVKRTWNKHWQDPWVKFKRIKDDNRNALTRRDKQQAVNAVLLYGHTRTQMYKQYGINALTLRRYIRAERIPDDTAGTDATEIKRDNNKLTSPEKKKSGKS